VLVLRGDPVGELVEVRLADDRVAGRLQPADGARRLRGDVVAEDRRPVRRPDARRVEEVLDAQADEAALGVLAVEPRDERVQLVARGRQSRRL
jgi:hypothetical protein